MGFGVQQAPSVMLAMDFYKSLADPPQQADTGWLIIDPGLTAPICGDTAAQDQPFTGLKNYAGLVQDAAYGVSILDMKSRSGAAIVMTGADLCPVCAFTGSKAKRSEKDGFAGTGFTGEGAQPCVKLRVQRIDENDISDRESCQHPANALAEQPVHGPLPVGRVIRLQIRVRDRNAFLGQQTIGVFIP